MASEHEYVAEYSHDVVGLFDSCFFEAVITDVDYDNDTADINITNPALGAYSSIPIFYHCPESTDTEGGSSAFAVDDNVLVFSRNCKGSLFYSGSMKIVGFLDGLKPCTIACLDLAEGDLGEDIAGDISYEVESEKTGGEHGTWSDINLAVIDIKPDGFSIDIGISFERDFYDEDTPAALYSFTLNFMLSAGIDLDQGWYHLTYDFEMVVPTIPSAVLTPISGVWSPFERVGAITICKNLACRFHGTHTEKQWDYYYPGPPPADPVEIVVDTFEECGEGYTGSYTECFEISNSDKGNSVHSNTIGLHIKCGANTKQTFSVDLSVTELDMKITNLKLRKINQEYINTEEPLIDIEDECLEDGSCISSVFWDYVGGE